jgi:hypothetical protein
VYIHTHTHESNILTPSQGRTPRNEPSHTSIAHILSPHKSQGDDEADGPAASVLSHRLLNVVVRQWRIMASHKSEIARRHFAKTLQRERGALLQMMWDTWKDDSGLQMGQDDDTGAHRQSVNNSRVELDTTADASGQNEDALEDVLLRLQAAVVETHTTHSRLLEMTEREEQLSRLLDRVPIEVSRAVTGAGITCVQQLIDIHAGACLNVFACVQACMNAYICVCVCR